MPVAHVAAKDAVPSRDIDERATYEAPTLTRLGRWQALTLQQSVPVAFFQESGVVGDVALARRLNGDHAA